MSLKEAGERLAKVNMLPVDRELDAAHLSVTGTLPRALNGTLFRIGPNPLYPNPAEHWFAGNGMVHAFEFTAGKATAYRNRWVRTERFTAAQANGAPLPRPDGAPRNDGGSANTNIIWHANRLLALEELHLPVQLDPKTLTTVGPDDRGGALHGSFTAHPKIDPQTGELLYFGYGVDQEQESAMTFGSIAADGRVIRNERFTAPYASMVHDFAVTNRFIVFPILPLSISRERGLKGKSSVAWEPELGAAFGIMPRNGSVKDLRWWRAGARYAYHVMNAWDDGRRVFVDVMEFAEPPLFPRADGQPADPSKTHAKLTRWTFDLDHPTDGFSAEALDDLSGEFPRIDDRYSGQPYRHGWSVSSAPGRSSGFDAIAHFDHADRSRRLYTLPAGDVPSEPVFVPEAPSAPEGKGWILTVIWRAAKGRSELLVLDALRIDAGPLATVHLPQRVPFGFHGNFVPA